MRQGLLDGQLLHESSEGVTWITLNRPEVGNAITHDQLHLVVDLLKEASADLSVRVVVLSGTGNSFCTGSDLRVNRPQAQPDGLDERPAGVIARGIAVGAQRLVASILDCEKPVITAVNGTAAGIGAHIAFASDLVVAAAGARFIEVFVRRGIVPDGGGAYLLSRLIGPTRTKRLMFFGDDLLAEEAERFGLINAVVPPELLDSTVAEWAHRLASGPTIAIGLTKWLVNRSLDSDRLTAFGDEAIAQEVIMTTHDGREGVDAFIERRPPQFLGR